MVNECKHENVEFGRYKDLQYGDYYTRTLRFTYCTDCGEIIDYSF